MRSQSLTHQQQQHRQPASYAIQLGPPSAPLGPPHRAPTHDTTLHVNRPGHPHAPSIAPPARNINARPVPQSQPVTRHPAPGLPSVVTRRPSHSSQHRTSAEQWHSDLQPRPTYPNLPEACASPWSTRPSHLPRPSLSASSPPLLSLFTRPRVPRPSRARGETCLRKPKNRKPEK
ncbi:hypothetical protein CALCODRAFT_112419 [Calocera cornea HHB12733]|uniref:Uncharacterized protein n=1 Tax=Calocera cornea HHB12733 TaxID=1353952 RepID=A0A165D180_9BASI|nr:hypothetical protein CALCODRAFT_112419 [Calocera cornea HHB12733]